MYRPRVNGSPGITWNAFDPLPEPPKSAHLPMESSIYTALHHNQLRWLCSSRGPESPMLRALTPPWCWSWNLDWPGDDQVESSR